MSGKTTKRAAFALAMAGLALLVPGAARADIDPGVRAGFYQDAEAGFIGGELLWDVTREWYFNPNIEYVFVDNGDLFTVNLDFHYDFQTRQPFYLWAGAGAALISSELDPPRGCRNCDSDRESDIGLNLLGGIGFGRGQAIRPYIQGKFILSDDTEAAIAVGLRFH
jgi:hypothetical protein